MKPKPLIFFLFTFIWLPSFAQNTFNWTDTVFTKGASKRVWVEWGLDSSGLRESAKDSLKVVVRFMNEVKFIKVEVGYYTDPQGSLKHNMILSRVRAQSIVNYLISQGIDSARLVPRGYGYTKPLPGYSAMDIARMKTKQEKVAAYQADRRTEVKIIAPDSGNIFGWNDVRFMKYSRREIKIVYGLDSANIRIDSLNKLAIDTVVRFLKTHPYLKVGVYVHTDKFGEYKHNMHLTQARAESVRYWLISKGIDSSQIIAKGWGYRRQEYSKEFLDKYYKSHQCCDDMFDYQHYPYLTNRRTEIVILGMR